MQIGIRSAARCDHMISAVQLDKTATIYSRHTHAVSFL